MGRGDGKTTRQLEKAIEFAREGHRILYVTRGPVVYYIGLAQKLLPEGKVSEARREILIPHANSIRFVEDVNVWREHLEGLEGIAVVDHAACPTNDGWHTLESQPRWSVYAAVPEPTDRPIPDKQSED